MDAFTRKREDKYCLRLFPRRESVMRSIENEKLNPHLQLNCKGSKTVSSIVQHLTFKWLKALPDGHCVRLYPKKVNFGFVIHQGWGLLDSEKLTMRQLYMDQCGGTFTTPGSQQTPLVVQLDYDFVVPERTTDDGGSLSSLSSSLSSSSSSSSTQLPLSSLSSLDSGHMTARTISSSILGNNTHAAPPMSNDTVGPTGKFSSDDTVRTTEQTEVPEIVLDTNSNNGHVHSLLPNFSLGALASIEHHAAPSNHSFDIGHLLNSNSSLANEQPQPTANPSLERQIGGHDVSTFSLGDHPSLRLDSIQPYSMESGTAALSKHHLFTVSNGGNNESSHAISLDTLLNSNHSIGGGGGGRNGLRIDSRREASTSEGFTSNCGASLTVTSFADVGLRQTTDISTSHASISSSASSTLHTSCDSYGGGTPSGRKRKRKITDFFERSNSSSNISTTPKK